MKYYELHEQFWQQLKAKGHISWDRESFDELFDRDRNKELDSFLEGQNGIEVLDLGCGSGSQSFYLTSNGNQCTAVDISKTAIDIGIELAKKLNLDIKFHYEDVCSLDLSKKFDLITDSCLLHCLVSDKHRSQFFDVVKKHMHYKSNFFVYTMINSEKEELFKEQDYLYLDQQGILWSKGPESFEVEWTIFNGVKYFPHRRIYKLKEQKNELEAQGFIIEKEKVLEGEKGQPAIYTAWLSKKGSQ